MIENTPIFNEDSIKDYLDNYNNPEIHLLLNKVNENYLYWSKIKYEKRPDYLTADQLWNMVKWSRRLMKKYTWPIYGVTIPITSNMQRQCHFFDMNFGGSWVNSSILPEKDRDYYLVNSMEDEAISSSQMEGASTTRKVAKEMLRKNSMPKNHSEQMIFNNYAAIKFLRNNKEEQLSIKLILQIHELMTKGTLENPDDAGRFRTDDNVVVENAITHEIVHTPPTFTEIPNSINVLCDFANTENEENFIHPIIKAIAIHFMIAYIHPFVDGNGRTARALFYWYMLKKGYWLTEYLSISRIIYKSKRNYENAYLYVESDENDMGYFIAYHLRALEIAFQDLKNYIEKKILLNQKNAELIQEQHLNARQAEILSIFNDSPHGSISVKDMQLKFSISHPTAKRDLDDLVTRGYLERVPVNNVKSIYIQSKKV